MEGNENAMYGPEPLARRMLHAVVLLLAALIVAVSCACCLVRPGGDPLLQRSQGHHAARTATAMLAAVR